MRQIEAVPNKQQAPHESKEKPLSPGIRGCLGCGMVMLLVVAALAYGARVGLQEAAREGILFTRPEPVLRRVPGGVLRDLQTKPDARMAFAVDVGWLNDHQVSFTSVRLPGWSDMMAFGQRGMGLGFWDKDKRRDFARQLVLEMFQQRVEYYDLRERKGAVLVDDTGQLFLNFGPRAWGPQGRRALLEGESVDWVTDDEKSPPSSAVYLFDRDGDTWTRLAAGREPVWCNDGKWVVFYRKADQGGRSLYRISPDGGEETLLYTGKFTLADQPRSERLSRYLYLWEASDSEGRQLVRIDPEAKQSTAIPLKPVGMQRGALSPTEIVHTRTISNENSGDRSEDDRTALIGALNVETGHFRIIRKGLPQKHGVAFSILRGRAILVRHWAVLEGEVSAGDTPDEERLKWKVLSCEDGKLRDGPDEWQAHISSPAGDRVAGSVIREDQYMGFIPMPTQSIAVWEIIDPDDILTGPEEDDHHASSAGRRGGE